MREFRFGVTLAGEPTGAEWVARAQEAERLGYSTLQFADHLVMHDPFVALMAAAAATSAVRLGPYVLCNDFRHPAVLARQAATFDVLTDGRLELGIGAGWHIDEYRRAGIPFDSPGARLDRLEESITVLRGLFGSDPFTFDGRHYCITELDGQPKPRQVAGPPIVVGGSGPRMLSLAARAADVVGIAVSTTPDGLIDCADLRAGTLERKVQGVREAAGGRFEQLELNTMITGPVVVTDDRAKDANAVLHFLREGGFPIYVPDDFSVDDVLESPYLLIGTHDEIARQLQDVRQRFGISYFSILGMSMHDFAPVIKVLSA